MNKNELIKEIEKSSQFKLKLYVYPVIKLEGYYNGNGLLAFTIDKDYLRITNNGYCSLTKDKLKLIVELMEVLENDNNKAN